MVVDVDNCVLYVPYVDGFDKEVLDVEGTKDDVYSLVEGDPGIFGGTCAGSGSGGDISSFVDV